MGLEELLSRQQWKKEGTVLVSSGSPCSPTTHQREVPKVTESSQKNPTQLHPNKNPTRE